MPPTPESLACEDIDAQLAACGWAVQDRTRMNLYAGREVAVREFPLATGLADYLLFVDRKAVGVVDAKAEGTTLAGVAEQAAMYSVGLPQNIPHVWVSETDTALGPVTSTYSVHHETLAHDIFIHCGCGRFGPASRTVRRSSAFASFLYATWQTLQENGVLCAWRST